MFRRLLRSLAWAFVAFSLAAAVLWVRARHHTDVFMAAWPDGPCLLVTSHRGGWAEFTFVRDRWPSGGVGWWAKDWRGPTYVLPLGADDRGPLKMWQRPGDVFNWGPPGMRGEFSLRRGTPAVMLDSGGRVLLDRTKGLPPGVWGNVAPGSPHWGFPQTSELRVPHWSLIVTGSLLPVGIALHSVGSRLRRRFTFKEGHCRSCGYDLRASPGRCPECGAAAPEAVTT